MTLAHSPVVEPPFLDSIHQHQHRRLLHFDGLKKYTDRSGYKLAQTVLQNLVKPLEEGIVRDQ